MCILYTKMVKSLKKESLSAMNNITKISFCLGIFMLMVDSCNRTVAPVVEPEQTLFENIPNCCSLTNCDFKDPAIKKLFSDTLTIRNATGIKTDDGNNIMRIDIKNNYIDPKRFPGWGNGNLSLFPCNMPSKLKNNKYQEVIFDFRLLYFIPLQGADYSGYPVELIKVKILSN
jgi:hypothetical protein